MRAPAIFLLSISLLATALVLPSTAAARSALVLPYPPSIGPIPAATYDDDGNRKGDAVLDYERLANGNIQLRAVASVASGARNVIEAELADRGDGAGLRVLWERSQSHDEDGHPLVVVRVDHELGEASCTPPEGSTGGREVVLLPKNDRVANTVMSLLFLPIVRGQETDLRYQSFLCRGGARLMDFVARRGEASATAESLQIVEIRFGPDLGWMVSRLATTFVPKLRFWFDAGRDGDYVAHRMPLYGGGPEIIVVREGVSARALMR